MEAPTTTVIDALNSIFNSSLSFPGNEGNLSQEGAFGGTVNNSSKDMWLNPTEEDLAYLTNNLEKRIEDGHVETIYEIGVEENGTSMGLTPEELAVALTTIKKAAQKLQSEVTILRQRELNGGKVAELLIRRLPAVDTLMEVRVAVVGNVDAGKSTMLGVLTRGVLDNGRGKARLNMFRHKHESDTGRTSSISHEIMGFNAVGDINNYEEHHKISWVDVCEKSSKIVTFIDLCGHEKYLKTTVFGLTGCAPDFVMLMVGANHGVIGMTKEHLGLALALNVPVFIVVTKIDMCPPNILQETLKQLTKILKSPGCRKIPLFVNSSDDVITMSRNFVSERICPIFQVSNVTGQNLEFMRQFLNLLPLHKHFNSHAPFEFQIDDTFLVPGVGAVVAGTVMSGTIRSGDTVLIGPDSLGNFNPVQIKSCHRKRVAVDSVSAGHSASFALKKIKRSQVRKGMVLVGKDQTPKACIEFEAEILVLFHSTTISTRYQAMTHCDNVRQTAGILAMDKEILRTGDRAKIRLQFLRHPEYLKLGSRVLFREGRTKAVGKVTKIIPLGTSEPLTFVPAIPTIRKGRNEPSVSARADEGGEEPVIPEEAGSFDSGVLGIASRVERNVQVS